MTTIFVKIYAACGIVAVISNAAIQHGQERIYRTASEPQETVTVAEPVADDKYSDIELSQDEIDLIAKIVYLEAGNQSAHGQQAVAEVILNRVINPNFPDNVTDVIYAQGQFTSVQYLDGAKPTDEQYQAIEDALHGEHIFPADVVFFARKPENDRVCAIIGEHYFCREYIW